MNTVEDGKVEVLATLLGLGVAIVAAVVVVEEGIEEGREVAEETEGMEAAEEIEIEGIEAEEVEGRVEEGMEAEGIEAEGVAMVVRETRVAVAVVSGAAAMPALKAGTVCALRD